LEEEGKGGREDRDGVGRRSGANPRSNPPSALLI
jgi:hypothetical protein